jgi:glycosyltransferase involved in cell wall biosynthesis
MPDRPEEPLVTVAMPVYNAGRFLRTAVLSILHQTYTQWELIIIDDGSTDGSLASIDDIDDPRIVIFRDNLNLSLAARLNQAIDAARGAFLARMDGDDISYPERFSSQVAMLLGDPELDLVAVRAVTISARDELIGEFPAPLDHARICARPWMGFHFPHPTWMGRIEWFRRHRYRSPHFYFPEDQELLLRSYRNSTFACVDEAQFAYRLRDRIRLAKVLRTRATLLRLQVSIFAARREPGFLLRSCAVFVLKVARDLWRSMLGKPPGPRSAERPQEHERRWDEVRLMFREGDRNP